MPDKNGLFSIKETFDKINNHSVNSIYLLVGNDAYLQSFFINHLAKLFSNEKIPKFVYSFNEDDGDLILNEITGISLFSEPKIFIIRGLNKIKKSHLKDLLAWYKRPNPDNCVVLIKNEFDIKNSIIKELKKEITIVDVRTPFQNKIKEWVDYILRIKEVKLNRNEIEILIESCGDSIANIENEIEKLILSGADLSNSGINESLISGNFLDYPIWKLTDSIGRKNLKQSIKIYNSLWMNNISLSQIIFNLNNLFQGIYWSLIGIKNNNKYSLNYFIQKNMNLYLNRFNLNEIMMILTELKKMDYKIKTLQISEKELMIPFIMKICKGMHGSI
jgi:DNA polymerase III delta subunit